MSGARMKIVPAVYERHAAHILELLNDAVVNTTWVYDCEPHQLEDFFQIKVNLKCWVKVKEDWRNRESLIRSFGLSEK